MINTLIINQLTMKNYSALYGKQIDLATEIISLEVAHLFLTRTDLRVNLSKEDLEILNRYEALKRQEMNMDNSLLFNLL